MNVIDIARWSGWASYVMETPTNDKEPNGAAPDDDKAAMKKLFASYPEDLQDCIRRRYTDTEQRRNWTLQQS